MRPHTEHQPLRENRSTEAQRWLLIKDLFNEALDLPSSERSAYLEKNCGADPSLRQEVEALLERERRLGDFLTEPVKFKDPDLGRLFGPYRLIKRLGSGGMGVVYLAQREPEKDAKTRGFQQTVAVKVLKQGLPREEMRRFHIERQILADLTHPNIARLLDGGESKEGRPFIAMEPIDGQPIDKYCQKQGLDLRQRVTLFREVCAAVHFAHKNLVIHRDLKPGNILVDSTGTPKLLDFGIAKLLTRNPGMSEVITRPGASPLSLAYASPEQVAGGPFTTATDVYSLGVVLYEMLTGCRPHNLKNLEPAQVLQILRSVEPSKPSSALLPRASEGEPEPKLDKKTTQLASGLKGDLDNIVLRALEPEPERRFASVEHFSEDLRRYLEGLPVHSRPNTLFYRINKLVRRNLLMTAVVALVGFLVLGFLLAMAVQHKELIHERNRAETAVQFMANFIHAPSKTGGTSLTVYNALRSQEKFMRQELVDQPEVRVVLLEAMGSHYRNFAFYEEARSVLEEAITIRRGLHGENSLELVPALHSLALVERYEENIEEAEKIMRQAITIQRVALARQQYLDPEMHRGLAAGLNNLALLLSRQGKLEEATMIAREALTLKVERFGPEDIELTKPLNTYARILSQREKYLEAEVFYRRSVDLHRRLGVPKSSGLANSLNALGAVVEARGDLVGAGELYEEALAIRRHLYDGDHPQLVTSLNNLAGQRILVNRLQEAQILLEEGLEMGQSLVSKGRTSEVKLGVLEKTLAQLWFKKGEKQVCEDYARSAVEKLKDAEPALLLKASALLEKCSNLSGQHPSR